MIDETTSSGRLIGGRPGKRSQVVVSTSSNTPIGRTTSRSPLARITIGSPPAAIVAVRANCSDKIESMGSSRGGVVFRTTFVLVQARTVDSIPGEPDVSTTVTVSAACEVATIQTKTLTKNSGRKRVVLTASGPFLGFAHQVGSDPNHRYSN